MKKQGYRAIMAAIVILSFAVAIYFYFYGSLPDVIATHWNSVGEVNGHMGKFWGLFLVPIISLGLFLLFMFIPSIDPMGRNIEKFRKEFDSFVVLFLLFMFYIYLISVVWNLGVRFSFIQFLVPALSVLFYFCGVLIGKTKRNWFIGIRTPWTLSSDRVWDKTHALGRKLFKVAAVINLLGIFFPRYVIWFVLLPLVLLSVYLVFYSYCEFRKENHK